jgi:hypothetical protein
MSIPSTGPKEMLASSIPVQTQSESNSLLYRYQYHNNRSISYHTIQIFSYAAYYTTHSIQNRWELTNVTHLNGTK